MFRELMPSSLKKKDLSFFFFPHSLKPQNVFLSQNFYSHPSLYLAFICYLMDFFTIWPVKKKKKFLKNILCFFK